MSLILLLNQPVGEPPPPVVPPTPSKRYGTFIYGDGTLYGEEANINLLHAVEVDWTGNGTTGENEALHRCVAMHITRGRRDYLVKSGEGFAHHQVGRASITLMNTDGRYDPYNTSSPLYPNVEPGKNIYIWLQNGSTGSQYDRFTGIIEDIVPIEDNTKVIIKAIDGWRYLLDNNISIPVKTNYRTDQAIQDILDAIGWPWGSDLDVGDDTLDYWWESDRSAAAAINDLVDSEFGSINIEADGTLRFRKRTSTESPVYTITQAEMLKDISTPQPWDTVRNIIEINVHPRVLQSNVELYSLSDNPLIKAGQSLEVWGDLTHEGRAVACLNYEPIKKASDEHIYMVSGCNYPDFDGEYYDNETTENGETVYSNKDGKGFLWWDGVDTWIISNTQGVAGTDYFELVAASLIGEYTKQGNADGSPSVKDSPDIRFTQATTYEISGCIDPDFNGEYLDNETYQGGKAAYTNQDGDGFLWWNGVDSWIISAVQGTSGSDYFKLKADDPVGTYKPKGTAKGSPSAEDGSDLSANIDVTVDLFGERAKFTFHNSGIVDGYLSAFRLRGDAIDTPHTSKAQSDKSVAGKAKKIFKLDVPWQTNINKATDYANYLADFLKETRIFPVIKIENRPTYQYPVDLNDSITVNISAMGIVEIYKIIYIDEQWLSETGQAVMTTLYTEDAPGLDDYMVFDSGQFDYDKFGY
mgnify:CR=1 FL=1